MDQLSFAEPLNFYVAVLMQCNPRAQHLSPPSVLQGREGCGSMLEKSMGGTQEVELQDGVKRKFLLDGDTVLLRGRCGKGVSRVGFGVCEGKVLPAHT